MYEAGVAVIGGGTWGRALASACARTGTKTLLVSRRPARSAGHETVVVTPTMSGIGPRARLYILAVPSHVVREVARELGAEIDGRHLVVHAVRGLAGDSPEPISNLLRQETPARRLGVLGGPALAEELLADEPSALVAGSLYPEVNHALSLAFSSKRLRVYPTNDLVGVEWASALVGCLAVGAGFAEAIGLKPSLLATFITRGVDEAARIARAAGGSERTLLSLAGYGDLLAAIGQKTRPEILAGAALARGMKVDSAALEARERVEALSLIPKVRAFAKANGLETPIFDALEKGVGGKFTPPEILDQLMSSPVSALPS